jgi:ribonuclease Z
MIFEVTILGSGAALPTLRRNPTAQYINCNERHILVDCGEGTQNQIRRFGIKIQKIKHIFISHLHGDHYFGLMGLLSTMSLLGRSESLTIYAPKELEEIIHLQLKASGHHYEFKMNFVSLDNSEITKVFEDKMIEIWALPMKHRVKTNGFLIKEKVKELSINGEMFRESGLSLTSIPFFRKGQNFVDENGKSHSYKKYTLPAQKAKSYAYFSDTAPVTKNCEFIQGFDALYHEATFTEVHLDRAKHTLHSTAKQAAEIAKTAKVKRLYLGHISSRYDSVDQHLMEAKSVFENTIIVEDGMKFYV